MISDAPDGDVSPEIPTRFSSLVRRGFTLTRGAFLPRSAPEPDARGEAWLRQALEACARGSKARYGATLRLAAFLEDQGSIAEKAELLRAAHAEFAVERGEDDSWTVALRVRLVEAERTLETSEQTLTFAIETADQVRRVFGEASVWFGEARFNVALIQLQLEQKDAAEDSLSEAEAIFTSIRAHEWRWFVVTMLAQYFFDEDRPSEARTYLDRAIECARELPEVPPEVPYMEGMRACLDVEEGDVARGVATLERTVPPLLEGDALDRLRASQCIYDLVDGLNRLGRHDDAVEWSRRDLELAQDLAGFDSPGCRGALVNLGRFLADAGDLESAQRNYELVLEAESLHPVLTAGVVPTVTLQLVSVLRRIGRLDRAAELLENVSRYIDSPDHTHKPELTFHNEAMEIALARGDAVGATTHARALVDGFASRSSPSETPKWLADAVAKARRVLESA